MVLAIVVGISPLAAVMVWAALQIKPGYIEGRELYIKAERLRSEGQIDEAITLSRQALGLDQNSADAHCTLGLALATRDEIEQAMTHFVLAQRIKPDHPVANYNIGYILHRQGRLQEARRHYENTLAVARGHAEAHNNLAMLLSGEEALDHFQAAVRLKPDYFEGHYNLANALGAMGRIDEAIKHYQKATEIDPHAHQPQFMLALIFTASADPAYKNPQAAVKHAARAAQLTNHRDAAVLNVLAAAQVSAGQLDEAVISAEQALAIAQKAEQVELARQIEMQLQLYRKRQADEGGAMLP